jgi:LuxR family maltose regulon positive regulatory protein
MGWWLENDGTQRAIHHALQAKAYEQAGELLCANWLEYMLSGSLETVREWIGRFPDKAMRDYPPILVASAWIAAFSGDAKGTHRFATAAREASFDRPMPDGTASYASSVEILRAGLGHDGLKDANEHAELAYSLEPTGSPWKPLTAALAGVTRFGLGLSEDARVALAEAATAPVGPDGVAIYARGQLALLEISDGNWEEGERQTDQARADIEELKLGNLLSSGAAQVAAAAVAAHFGNRGLARQLLRSLAPLQKVLTDAIPFDAFQIHLLAAETYLVIGDYRAANVHARTACSRLERFGDGGIFERRLEETMRTLESANETASTFPVEPEPLTDRELQILTLLESELSLRDIGGKLFVSRNTAKTHVASVYRKLGVTTRTAAIARARQLDLI